MNKFFHYKTILLPAKIIPIVWELSRANVIVVYMVPRSAAKPESSDWAGLIALSTMYEKKNIKKNIINEFNSTKYFVII